MLGIKGEKDGIYNQDRKVKKTIFCFLGCFTFQSHFYLEVVNTLQKGGTQYVHFIISREAEWQLLCPKPAWWIKYCGVIDRMTEIERSKWIQESNFLALQETLPVCMRSHGQLVAEQGCTVWAPCLPSASWTLLPLPVGCTWPYPKDMLVGTNALLN